MRPLDVGRYMVIDPRVCHGKLTFKGTRVPVQTILTFLAMGETIDDILKDWPYLKRTAVEEAIQFAAAAWPELLRKKTEKVIRRLAEQLEEREPSRANASHESTHSG